MAFFGIGKKTPKAGSPSEPSRGASDHGMEFGEAAPVAVNSAKKGLFGSRAKKTAGSKTGAVLKTGAGSKTFKASKPKVRGASGELNIYTGVLAAAIVMLAAGCILIAMDNLSGVVGTNEEGNPFAVISSR